VLAAPAALVSFGLYLWHVTGDPLAWSKAEHTWGRAFSPGGLWHALAQLVTGSGSGWLWRDAAFSLVYVAALAVAYRAGVPRSWILAGVAICLLPLASGSFESAARYGVLALPVFFGLAVLGRNPRFDRLMWIAGPIGLCAFTFAILFDAP
jgi:hypothetical protein